MSFVSELRHLLVSEKEVYDLSKNEEFKEFNFIGVKETSSTIDMVAFIQADSLTETQIVSLRDKFFRIVQIVSYDFGIKPRGRNPNALLGFIFDHQYSPFLRNFIQKQTKIIHSGKSAVLVSWVIDTNRKQIYTHHNPVSLIPPVVIMDSMIFPGLKYLESCLNNYSPSFSNQPPYFANASLKDSKISVSSDTIINPFDRLDKRLDEIYSFLKNMSQNPSKYNFPNVSKVQIFEQVNSYVENQNISQNNTEYISKFLEELEEFKEMIKNLEEKYDNINDSQAVTIRDRKFKEIQRNQPEIWKNIVQLKRLWNGIKGGTVKLGEHFAEDSPLGKAAIGFLEGLTDDID